MGCSKSILETGYFEINVKRSRFIGSSRRCESEEEAKSFIKNVSQEHSSASHSCWAYRISLPGKEVANYSDAGEPHGSAGQPILGAIDSLELTNVVVVVTRYFGGVKLGIRGLIDAYGGTALESLKAAKPVTFRPGIELIGEMAYTQWNDFSRLFRENKDFSLQKVDYSDRVLCVIAVRKDEVERVTGFFEERRISFRFGDELNFVSPVE